MSVVLVQHRVVEWRVPHVDTFVYLDPGGRHLESLTDQSPFDIAGKARPCRVNRGSLSDGKAWLVLHNNHVFRPQPVPRRPGIVGSNGVAGVIAPIALPVLFPEFHYFHVGVISFHQFGRSSCQLIQMLPLAQGFDGSSATSAFTDTNMAGIRSEEVRGGKECGSTFRSWGSA